MRLTRRAMLPMAAGAGLAMTATARASQDNGTPTAGTPAAAATPAGDGVTLYALPGTDVYPEGVTYDPAGPGFFAGSNANGTIYRGNIDDGTVEIFVEGADQGLTSVNGLWVDARGLLWACGVSTGRIAVYDTTTARPLGQFSNGLPQDGTFINDVTVVGNTGYATDSTSPTLWVVSVTDDNSLVPGKPISFKGTAFAWHEGINANGIVGTVDGSALVVIDSGTGNLYRVDIATTEVSQIDTGGADLTAGDGLALDGDVLYVCRNQVARIVRLRLAPDARTAALIDDFTSDAFAFPTTIALTERKTLLACNSQFDTRGHGAPALPFTVAEVPIPDLPTESTPIAGAASPAAGPGTPEPGTPEVATPDG